MGQCGEWGIYVFIAIKECVGVWGKGMTVSGLGVVVQLKPRAKQKQYKKIQNQQYQVFFPNKNYTQGQYIMKNLSTSLLLHDRHDPNENWLTLNTAFPLKLSSTSQIIVVKNQTEEMELLNSLVWRQNTSMPVVKVLSFKNQGTCFPKSYTIEVQYIQRSVKNLWEVNIKDCLYLIQQCLLGVQALQYKYHQFDFHQIFYGITESGQAKVWISQQLTQHRSQQLPLPKQDIIIGHILKMIIHIGNIESKQMLSSFLHETAQITNLEYSQLHIRLHEFANRNRILIPPCLNIQKRTGLVFNSKSQIFRRDAHSLDNGQIKVSFRYQSPMPKSMCQKFDANLTPISLKNDWLYDNKNSRMFCESVSSRTMNPESISYEFISHHQQKPKDISKMLCSPNRLKQRLKQSKNSLHGSTIKASIKDIKSIKEFENENKSQKTCTSLTMKNDNDLLKVNKVNLNMQRSGIQGQSKLVCSSLVVSNTNLSQCLEDTRHKNNHVSIVQDCQEVKNNDSSQNRLQIFLKGIGTAYNFGGLLPLPQVPVKQSQYIQQHHIQVPEQKKPQNILKVDNRRKNLQSLVLSQTEIQAKIADLGWQNKMSKLISQDESNLKQSVYCGEEKKPQPLQIKLQMLGRLGRQITSMIH